MNRLGILLFMFWLVSITSAAGQQDYSQIPLKTAEDCKKAEPEVLKAVNFILSKRVCDQDALTASLFNIKWMENTAHTFSVNRKVSKLSDKKKNPLLVGVYLACLTKFVLENPDKLKDEKTVQLGACRLFADYLRMKDNDVVMTKGIKKFLEAEEQGKLEAYLGYK
ncbi:MAG: hypothetical protein AB1458_08265 [Bacteroidota bacterium]